jgi:hypothetical protein
LTLDQHVDDGAKDVPQDAHGYVVWVGEKGMAGICGLRSSWRAMKFTLDL